MESLFSQLHREWNRVVRDSAAVIKRDANTRVPRTSARVVGAAHCDTCECRRVRRALGAAFRCAAPLGQSPEPLYQ